MTSRTKVVLGNAMALTPIVAAWIAMAFALGVLPATGIVASGFAMTALVVYGIKLSIDGESERRR